MKLYWKDTLVAKQEGSVMKLQDVEDYMIPYRMFGKNNELKEIPAIKLLEWAKKRCMPRERMGLEDELKRLGLDRYDRIMIVERTAARLIGHDWFWIDFETPNSIHEYDPSYGIYTLDGEEDVDITKMVTS